MAVEDSAPASLFWHSWQRLVVFTFCRFPLNTFLILMCPLLLKKTQNRYTICFYWSLLSSFSKTKGGPLQAAQLTNFPDRCGVWWEDVPVQHVEWIESLRGIGNSPTSEGDMLCWKLHWMDILYTCLYIAIVYYIDQSVRKSYLERRRPVTGVRKYQTSLRSSLITRESRNIQDVWDSTPNGTIYDLDRRGKSIQFNNWIQTSHPICSCAM